MRIVCLSFWHLAGDVTGESFFQFGHVAMLARFHYFIFYSVLKLMACLCKHWWRVAGSWQLVSLGWQSHIEIFIPLGKCKRRV